MDMQNLYAWKEVAHKVFYRPVDEPELYYQTNVKIWEATGRTASAITAHIGISLDSSWTGDIASSPARVEDSLRYAWKQIRYHCPILASSVEWRPELGTMFRLYEIADDDIIAKWMEETFTVVRTGQTSLEFMRSDPPVPRATLFIFPGADKGEGETVRYDIVFRCGHDVTDALATYAVLDHLVRFAAHAFQFPTANLHVPFGDERKNLTPPFRIILGLPSEIERPFKKSEIDKMQHQRTKERADGLGIPYKAGSWTPGETHSAALSFTIAETRAVLSACKLRGATVTQVIHAGIALAVRDLQPKTTLEKSGKYVSYAIASLRKFCKSPYNGHRYAMSTCHVNSTSSLVVHMTIPPEAAANTVQASKEFQNVLDQVQTYYKTKAVPDNLLDAALCFAARTPEFPKALCSIPAPSSAPGVAFSSRGIIDQYIQARYGLFEVHDPWCVTTELSPGIGVSASTWKESLCLRASYNDAFQEVERVKAFLLSVKMIVMEGLEIV